mmetsp:Transcript_6279/g.15846  ORF Transcript_6279/g.15846 Transcript_6279/m.15846 type:complete len:265 (+) Transcript_6279:2777-3571(+)
MTRKYDEWRGSDRPLLHAPFDPIGTNAARQMARNASWFPTGPDMHEAWSSRHPRKDQARLGKLGAGERADWLGRGRGGRFGGTAQKGCQGRMREGREALGSEADGGVVLAKCEAQEDTRRVRRRRSVEWGERERGDPDLHGEPLGQLHVAVGAGALAERCRHLGHHEVARVGAVDGEAGLAEHVAELLALLVEHLGVGRDEALDTIRVESRERVLHRRGRAEVDGRVHQAAGTHKVRRAGDEADAPAGARERLARGEHGEGAVA